MRVPTAEELRAADKAWRAEREKEKSMAEDRERKLEEAARIRSKFITSIVIACIVAGLTIIFVFYELSYLDRAINTTLADVGLYALIGFLAAIAFGTVSWGWRAHVDTWYSHIFSRPADFVMDIDDTPEYEVTRTEYYTDSYGHQHSRTTHDTEGGPGILSLIAGIFNLAGFVVLIGISLATGWIFLLVNIPNIREACQYITWAEENPIGDDVDDLTSWNEYMKNLGYDI